MTVIELERSVNNDREIRRAAGGEVGNQTWRES